MFLDKTEYSAKILAVLIKISTKITKTARVNEKENQDQ
jgi:hypothetical protein